MLCLPSTYLLGETINDNVDAFHGSRGFGDVGANRVLERASGNREGHFDMHAAVGGDRNVTQHPELFEAPAQLGVLDRADGRTKCVNIHHRELLSR